MRAKVRQMLFVGVCVGAFCTMNVVNADEVPASEASTHTLTSNIAIASQYVTRGFAMTWGKPALQGGIDYANTNGWFAGTWMSTISPKLVQDGYMEWDLYGGYGTSIGPVAVKGTLYYYLYPDAEIRSSGTANGKSAKYDFGELQLGATWKWITFNVWYTYTKDYYGSNGDTLFDSNGAFYADGKNSRGSVYYDTNLNFDLGNGVTALMHYGYQTVRNYSDWDSSDYKVGLTKSIDSLLGSKGWSISAAYTGMSKVNDYYKDKNAAVPFLSATGDGSTSSPAGSHFVVVVGRAF